MIVAKPRIDYMAVLPPEWQDLEGLTLLGHPMGGVLVIHKDRPPLRITREGSVLVERLESREQ